VAIKKSLHFQTMCRLDSDYLTKLLLLAGKIMGNHWWKR